MYNQTYEDYIRSILGYPNNTNSMYGTNSREDVYSYPTINSTSSEEIEQYYPEIYRIIYPMVCKSCNSNTNPITRELIDNMTDEIYFAIESNNEIEVNITLNNEVRSNNNEENLSSPKSATNNRNIVSKINTQDKNFISKEENIKENRKENRGKNREDRQVRNNTLRDLIRILIIRQLLQNRPNRPNFPPQPPRPPFPGGPRTRSGKTTYYAKKFIL